jgi:hypothetical protein
LPAVSGAIYICCYPAKEGGNLQPWLFHLFEEGGREWAVATMSVARDLIGLRGIGDDHSARIVDQSETASYSDIPTGRSD